MSAPPQTSPSTIPQPRAPRTPPPPAAPTPGRARRPATGDVRGRGYGVAAPALLAAALTAGLAFHGVFAPLALLVPVVAALAGVGAVDLVAAWHPSVAPLRAPLASALGFVLVLAVLSVPFPFWDGPTGPAAALDGVVHGWRETLSSTLPARPEPALLAFVPVLVLLASVLSLEWLRRGVAPLATLAPSLAVVVLAQLFRTGTGVTPVALAAGWASAAAVVLAAGRPGRLMDTLRPAVPLVLVAIVGACALVITDPLGRQAYSVADRYQSVSVPAGTVSPLAELGGRLARPDTVVFTVRTDAAVDRWPQLVLDRFDGAEWGSGAVYRPLGSALDPDPAVTLPRREASAEITLGPGATDPWLPSQQRTSSVDGVRPAVDPVTGTLLDPTRSGDAYTLRWSAPQPGRDDLVGAAVDPSAAAALPTAAVPAGVLAATREAIGDAPPSFATALRLETWLKDTHTVATGDQIPTGAGNAQILDFLTRTKRGTSEQFAAAYVLMARSAGIPARLVVGFRQPDRDSSGAYTVRSGDAFAWPEVAVAGAGWVPLDPAGGAKPNPRDTPPTTEATEAARQQDQQPTQPLPQQVAPPEAQPVAAPDAGLPIGLVVAVGLAVVALLAWLAGVPLWKALRRRRRRAAPGGDGVVGAWMETRDRLRDSGVRTGDGMTVRDLADPAGDLLDGRRGALERLARCVDHALWSGHRTLPPEVHRDAWAAVAVIDDALAARPVPDRVRSAVALRSLMR